MVFIRAKILRDSIQTAFETNAKYNAIRGVLQQGSNFGLLRSNDRPALPPIDTYQPAEPENSAPQPESEE
jgi:hypothetical protein